MKIKCPNCGTIMENGDGTGYVLPNNLDGTAYLVPKEIHNDNLVKEKENNTMMTRDAKGRFVSKKVACKEENNMNNNTKGSEMPFTVEELMNNMAELMLQKMTAATTETKKAKRKNEVEKTGKGYERSNFYGEELYDGYIFNPYLDRRWLPAQYLNMIANEPNHSAYTAIKKHKGFDYSIEWTKKEAEKLAYLQKTDPAAFVVRKAFLSLDDVYKIMEHYVNVVKNDITEEENKYTNGDGGKDAYFYGGKVYYFGEVKATVKKEHGAETIVHVLFESDEIKALKAILDDFLNRLQKAVRTGNYRKVSNILEGFNFKKSGYDKKKSGVFMDRYLAQGAWFTLRNMVIFEGYSLKGMTGEEAVNELFAYTGLEGYKLHAILIQCLEDNGYKFRVGNYR